MSFLDQLVPGPLLQTRSWPDIDSFRGLESLAKTWSIPLRWGGLPPAAAFVELDNCTIYLERTFPRILQTEYRTKGCVLAFSFDDFSAARVNGIEVRTPSVVLTGGKVVCDIVEQHANLIALVDFHSMPDRAWPRVPDRPIVILSEAEHLHAIQTIVRKILWTASTSPERLSDAALVQHMQKELFESVDRIFHGNAIAQCNTRQLNIVRRLDELLDVNHTDALSSNSIVEKLDLPLRTLSAAVNNVRGVSLQHYARLRRLWNVRRSLHRGAVPVIKVLAQANGFRHMGEFSKTYREFFGETPSQTLARVNAHP